MAKTDVKDYNFRMKNVGSKDKWLYLVGATGNLGKALSQLYASREWNICLLGRNEELLRDLEISLHNEFGINTKSYSLELNNPESSADVLKTAMKDIGDADAFVYAAGKTGLPTDSLTYQDWRSSFSINLDSPFFMAREFARCLSWLNKSGSVVTISSSAAFYAGKADYSASKLALVSITRSLAKEYAQNNIRVNSVAPGYIESEIITWSQEKRAQKQRNVPLFRFAKTLEVASTVYFLTSEESSYITGAVIDVNGGLLFR